MTRDEALDRIARCRSDCQAMLGQGILDDEVGKLIVMFDDLRALVTTEWPLSEEGRKRVYVGRYAARALDEDDYSDLSRDISQLDWDLTH